MRLTIAIIVACISVVALYFLGRVLSIWDKPGLGIGLAYGVLYFMLPSLAIQVGMEFTKKELWCSASLFISVMVGAVALDVYDDLTDSTWGLIHGGIIIAWPLFSLVAWACLGGLRCLAALLG